MNFWRSKPYQPVSARQKKAEAAIAKSNQRGTPMAPVLASRGPIAKTFWGKAWCDNLEHYSDYSNRLPRGRTYVRNGSVIDLSVAPGEVRAQVMGSALYKVVVTVASLPNMQWQEISEACSGSIDSLVELLQGQLSNAVMERICKPGSGLFPAPKEIEFQCSCPDWAEMCKHVAAVLYGVGARLDQQPELIFTLRRVDAKNLVTQAGAGLPKSKQGPAAGKALDVALLADVFDIEMADVAPATKPAAPHHKSTATKVAKMTVKVATTTTRKAPAAGKTEAIKQAVVAQKPAKPRVPVQAFAGSRKSTARKVTASKAKTRG